jgi:uncharacterized protein YecT (DUF1311 family)
MFKLCLAAATVAVAVPAFGQTRAEVDAAYSPAFNACMKSGDAAGGVTSAMMDCNGLENIRQDERLNHAYRTAMARLQPGQKAVLRLSERKWLQQRKKVCQDAANSAGGGSASGLIYSSCFLDETVKRKIWLQRYRPKS